MKIAAFLQLYNELENGHLQRCLSNCRQWADEIFIYDDASDDGSQKAYLDYTDKDHIIFGKERDFQAEGFHKQELLALTLSANPDWIFWQDGDAILSRNLTLHLHEMLGELEDNPFFGNRFDGVRIHYCNLWRHPKYRRLDNLYDGLWPLCIWKNTGNLRYEPMRGLHGRQYPLGPQKSTRWSEENEVLHYGFASEYWIVKKYLTYISFGEACTSPGGWERLIDEQSSFVLEQVPKEMFPEENIPEDYDTVKMPSPITYSEYRKYKSWEEYIEQNPSVVGRASQ